MIKISEKNLVKKLLGKITYLTPWLTRIYLNFTNTQFEKRLYLTTMFLLRKISGFKLYYITWIHICETLVFLHKGQVVLLGYDSLE